MKTTHNAQDAADICQSTYVRVFESIHRFGGASRLATWVYRVAVNEALQLQRREERRRVRELQRKPDAVTISGAPVSDARIDVAEAMTRLSAEERALIVLRYFEGLRYAEMAEALDKSSGTIGSELSRVTQKLRDLLGTEAPIAPG